MSEATSIDHALLASGDAGDAAISDALSPPGTARGARYRIALVVTGAVASLFFLGGLYTILTGIGVWGNSIPVAWAFAITNFVFWIGIGHAGTFISAILLLFGARWRSAVNRIAEAMTIVAVVIAGMFPILHLGRAWFAYWLAPYPDTMRVWPQFSSALCWDLMAVLTYLTISILFWYLGLVPDLALLRDRSTSLRRRRIYGIFALGFCGSARQWKQHRAAQIVLAGLATPLVLSVHSVVSMDFAIGIVPGWHSTIFPPYFVAGAIFSGVAMVITIVVPMRVILRYEPYITIEHLDQMARLMLVTGLIVAYSYGAETFTAWYSGDPFERRMYFETRPFGPFAFSYWIVLACNVGAPQLLWWSRVRRSPLALLAVALLVNVGMWMERFMIIVTSLQHDFLASSAGGYTPTPVDGAILLGTFGFFLFVILLVTRYVPVVSIVETKELRRELLEEVARG